MVYPADGTAMTEARLFDDWPERYDQWFETPVGRFIKAYESELILELLHPSPNELILDAGCGTGIFTSDFLARGARVVGLDISRTMLQRAAGRGYGFPLALVQGDMLALPFASNTFDKTVSVTAIEFIPAGREALAELFRVTKPGGVVVLATLNSLSPWAARRQEEAKTKENSIFAHAIFRSEGDLRVWTEVPAKIKTAVHFPKAADLAEIPFLEAEGRRQELLTGAFIAARWVKP